MFYEKTEQLVIQLKQTLATSYILCSIITTLFLLKVLVSYCQSQFQTPKNSGILRPSVFFLSVENVGDMPPPSSYHHIVEDFLTDW